MEKTISAGLFEQRGFGAADVAGFLPKDGLIEKAGTQPGIRGQDGAAGDRRERGEAGSSAGESALRH